MNSLLKKCMLTLVCFCASHSFQQCHKFYGQVHIAQHQFEEHQIDSAHSSFFLNQEKNIHQNASIIIQVTRLLHQTVRVATETAKSNSRTFSRHFSGQFKSFLKNLKFNFHYYSFMHLLFYAPTLSCTYSSCD